MKPSDQIRHAIVKALDAHLPSLDEEIYNDPDAISGMRPPLVSIKVGLRRHNKTWKAEWTSKLITTDETVGSVEIEDPNQANMFD